MFLVRALTCVLACGAPLGALATRAAPRTHYADALLPGVAGDMPFNITDYGRPLADNKAKLAVAFGDCRTTAPLRSLMIAEAMVETNTMSIAERDASKDNTTDGAANVSLFNLSVDLVKSAGYRQDPWLLNDPKRLPEVVCLIADAIDLWGLPDYLDFVRGGRAAFLDHVSYGAPEYQRTIKTILLQLDADPRLLTDGRRVEVDLPHV